MSLHRTVPLILASVVLLYLGLDFAAQRYFVLPSYIQLERELARLDLGRAAALIDRELFHLNGLCLDWAAWDDTYAYVADPDAAYEASNLVTETFSDNALSLMFIVDLQGKVVWGRAFDEAIRDFVTIEGFPSEHWAATHPLLNHPSPGSQISGLLTTPRGPMLVSSQPIIQSDNEGPVRGTLIMGRFLNSTYTQTLRRLLQIDIEVFPAGAFNVPLQQDGPLGPDGVWFVDLSPEVLQAHRQYPDYLSNPALVLRLNAPRKILREGLNTVRLNAIAALAAAALTFIVVLGIMQRLVTRPLTGLVEHVRGIARSDSLAQYPAFPRSEEIATLAREFNHMVARLRADIEERRRAEEALHESETRMRNILATAPDGVITIDAEGVIESANRIALDMLGISDGLNEGYSLRESLSPGDWEWVCTALSGDAGKITDEKLHIGHEMLLRRSDGSVTPVHLKLSAMRLGEDLFHTCILRDITEFKALHEDLLRSKHLAAIGEMGASIAHEIRNPLAGISGAVQILLKEVDPGHTHHEVMKQVLDLVHRVESTIQQLLDYSRQWNPLPEPVSLLALAKSVGAELSIRPSFHGVQIEYFGEEAATVQADPRLIRQVIENLIENAAQAMPQGGLIRCGTDLEGGSDVLTVGDAGSGVTPEVADNLFRPFFTTKTYGTGLGLSICRRIMEAHGGTILIENNEQGGATARLSFN